MSKKQLCWHTFHAETLCQYVDIEARRAQIEEIKPEHELPTRRRLMKPVIGDLPEEFVVACVKEEAARVAWKAAREAQEEAREAQKAAREAQEAAYQTHKTEIERLHAIECPDCPWDGKTIFPN